MVRPTFELGSFYSIRAEVQADFLQVRGVHLKLLASLQHGKALGKHLHERGLHGAVPLQSRPDCCILRR